MPKTVPKLSEQHPVPQHIAAFEFKLIGDLTIKQFLFAGVGVAVAYAAWISDLNFFSKWLIIIAAGGIGLGTAFFPIQDRTFDQWLLNFLAAILSPTQRVWHKEPLPPEFLREDYSQFLTSQVLSMTPLQSRRKLQQYLHGLEEKRAQSEIAEEEFIKKLNFDLPLKTEPLPTKEAAPREPQVIEKKPTATPEVRIAFEPHYQIPLRTNITPGRKIRLPVIEGIVQLPPSPVARTSAEPRPLPERKILPPLPRKPLQELIKARPSLPTPPPDEKFEQMQRQNRELQTRLAEAERQLQGLMELKQELSAKEDYRQRLLEQERLVQKLTARQKSAQKEISEIKGVSEEEPVSPAEPGGPNIVTGAVRDREGKLLENMVVIIKDQDGDPVRALKTNRLGQFAITTPLEIGDYAAEVSSPTKSFAIIKISADGSVLPAVDFREKNA